MGKNKFTEARKNANQKWDAVNLKRMSLALLIDEYTDLKSHAEMMGETTNGFIRQSIKERINRYDLSIGSTNEIAYNILYRLEHHGKPMYMGQMISPTVLNAKEDKWLSAIEMLTAEGYIDGIKIKVNLDGKKSVDISNVHITLKGAAYLDENSAFEEFRKVATDIITCG